MPKTIEVALTLITSYDERRKDLELSLLQTAQRHDPHTLSRLQTVPGIGKILSLVLLDAMHDLRRLPSGQDFASSGRLVTCRTASAGQRLGTSGSTSGHAHLTWALSEAATLFLRTTIRGQKLRAHGENKHDTGTALSMLAPTLARAVSVLRKRREAFEMDIFLQSCGSSAGEPGASLDTTGMRLT